MSHGKHRGAHRPADPAALRQLAFTSGAIFAVAGLILGVAVPAQAATSIRDEAIGAAAYAQYTAYVKNNTQTLTVSASAAQGTSPSRDGISATSQAALDAANAAVAAHIAEIAEAAANLSPAAAKGLPTTGYPGPIIPASGTSTSAIIAYADQFVGVVPYIESPNAVSPATGFECDSFVDWVFAHTTGRILPRGVDEIAALGAVVPAAAAQSGDLVVYVGKHIGIYEGDGIMVDAPAPGEFVKEQSVWGAPVYVRL